jgi:hypothetical protein
MHISSRASHQAISRNFSCLEENEHVEPAHVASDAKKRSTVPVPCPFHHGRWIGR